jgi:hypothetical protein
VAVEDQRAPAAAAFPGRDHVALAVDAPAERRVAGVGAQRVRVERHVDRLQPAVGERPRHDRLPGILVAQHRRALDELGQQRVHPLRLGGHRGIDHRTLPSRICSVLRSL